MPGSLYLSLVTSVAIGSSRQVHFGDKQRNTLVTHCMNPNNPYGNHDINPDHSWECMA